MNADMKYVCGQHPPELLAIVECTKYRVAATDSSATFKNNASSGNNENEFGDVRMHDGLDPKQA
jgi:hypothetical protein